MVDADRISATAARALLLDPGEAIAIKVDGPRDRAEAIADAIEDLLPQQYEAIEPIIGGLAEPGQIEIAVTPDPISPPRIIITRRE